MSDQEDQGISWSRKDLGISHTLRRVDLFGSPGVSDIMEVGSETCQHLCPHHQQQQLQQKRKTVTHALEDQKKVRLEYLFHRIDKSMPICCKKTSLKWMFGKVQGYLHLADAFIQSDLQCIQAIHLYCQYVCSLGIKPTTFALLTQCSNHWATGTLFLILKSLIWTSIILIHTFDSFKNAWRHFKIKTFLKE